LWGWTWKQKVTPLGRRYLVRQQLERPTSASGCTSVPTPQTHDVTTRGNTEADGHYYPHDLSNAAELSAVPTPCTPNGGRSCSTDIMDATGRTIDGRKHAASLEHAVKFAEMLATCATPRANDAEKRGEIATDVRNGLPGQAMLSSVTTPSARDFPLSSVHTPNCPSAHATDNDAGRHYPTQKQKVSSGTRVSLARSRLARP
jgi:hypothetical protein